MRFLTNSEGIRLAYDIEGSGPPLLLHLGAGCDSGLWGAAGYLSPLAQIYTCILFDHRGHGESDKPRGKEAYSLDRLTADVVELLDHLGIDSAAFWGYSMGMYPGIRLAECEPDRIWALIASGSIGAPGPPDTRYSWIESSAADYRANGWQNLIARFDTEEQAPVPEWMKERIRATDIEQFVNTFEAFPDTGWEEWDALPNIETPTLFLTGELEDPENEVAVMVGMMKHAELLRLGSLGHINAFLATYTVLERVLPFLAEHAPKPD
ncbi:MAG TPA: alpha/beta hydrolase [Gemmatimonadaceae bacterium]|nr:alpha/beta hydrolase [Gemmatimonadaceae bacterium]